MRKIQVTKQNGEKYFLTDKQALQFAKTFCTSHMILESFLGGIAIKVGDDLYEMQGSPLDHEVGDDDPEVEELYHSPNCRGFGGMYLAGDCLSGLCTCKPTKNAKI